MKANGFMPKKEKKTFVLGSCVLNLGVREGQEERFSLPGKEF